MFTLQVENENGISRFCRFANEVGSLRFGMLSNPRPAQVVTFETIPAADCWLNDTGLRGVEIVHVVGTLSRKVVAAVE